MPGTHTLRRGIYHSGTGMAQGAAGTKGPGGCQGSAGTADWKVGEIRRDEPCAGTLLFFPCLPEPSLFMSIWEESRIFRGTSDNKGRPEGRPPDRTAAVFC